MLLVVRDRYALNYEPEKLMNWAGSWLSSEILFCQSKKKCWIPPAWHSVLLWQNRGTPTYPLPTALVTSLPGPAAAAAAATATILLKDSRPASLPVVARQRQSGGTAGAGRTVSKDRTESHDRELPLLCSPSPPLLPNPPLLQWNCPPLHNWLERQE